MSDPHIAHATHTQNGPEYILYTFERSGAIPQRLQWKKQSITTSKLSAFQAGQKLFSLKKYARIELYERMPGDDSQNIKPIHRWQPHQTSFSIYNLFWISGIIILLASLIVFYFH